MMGSNKSSSWNPIVGLNAAYNAMTQVVMLAPLVCELRIYDHDSRDFGYNS